MDLVDLESRVAASPIATSCTRGVVVIEKKDMVEDSSREDNIPLLLQICCCNIIYE